MITSGTGVAYMMLLSMCSSRKKSHARRGSVWFLNHGDSLIQVSLRAVSRAREICTGVRRRESVDNSPSHHSDGDIMKTADSFATRCASEEDRQRGCKERSVRNIVSPILPHYGSHDWPAGPLQSFAAPPSTRISFVSRG